MSDCLIVINGLQRKLGQTQVARRGVVGARPKRRASAQDTKDVVALVPVRARAARALSATRQRRIVDVPLFLFVPRFI